MDFRSVDELAVSGFYRVVLFLQMIYDFSGKAARKHTPLANDVLFLRNPLSPRWSGLVGSSVAAVDRALASRESAAIELICS